MAVEQDAIAGRLAGALRVAVQAGVTANDLVVAINSRFADNVELGKVLDLLAGVLTRRHLTCGHR